MSRNGEIRKHQVGFALLLLFGGICKAALGLLIFSRQPLTTLAIAALFGFAFSFIASRILRNHPSDSELPRIAEILGLAGGLLYGLILLGLLLTDWRHALGFTAFLLLSSARLLSRIPVSRRMGATPETF